MISKEKLAFVKVKPLHKPDKQDEVHLGHVYNKNYCTYVTFIELFAQKECEIWCL